MGKFARALDDAEKLSSELQKRYITIAVCNVILFLDMKH